MHIQYRLKTVSIDGEVNRPGIYELIPGEDINDLINISGGLKITAYLPRAQIDRIVPFDERDSIGAERVFKDVNLNHIIQKNQDFKLQDGDKIRISSILDQRQNSVTINGGVVRPGQYEILDSTTVKDLIIKADSLLGDTYMDRLDIIRINPDFSEQLITINLLKAMDNDPEHNIILKDMDVLNVYSTTKMISNEFISVSGHVEKGFVCPKENMTLKDLIFESGGFIDLDFKNRTYLERAELVRVSDKSLNKEIIRLI